MVLVNDLLQLVKAQLVAVFEASIVFLVSLNCIVREMNGRLLAVVENVLRSRSAQVAFSAKEHFHILIDQNPDSDVELAVVN